jgi:hypothetical protein
MPTLDVLKKLAIALSVSADSLLFDEHERGPDDDLRFQSQPVSNAAPATTCASNSKPPAGSTPTNATPSNR